MLNKIIIAGRLGRDPEIRAFDNGDKVASFSVAVDRDYKDKQTGERATDWIDVKCFRATAEFVERYVSKGRMIIVEGRLQVRNYEGRDGNKRRAVEVVAQNVYFSDSRNAAAGEGSNGPEGRVPGDPLDQTDRFDAMAGADDELPF